VNQSSANKPLASLRPAASVMLFRDADNGPEVLLLERPAQASFGGSWVFPGGGLEHDDSDELYDGLGAQCTETIAQQKLGLQSDALCWFIAAIREVFEETGIVLSECRIDDVEAGTQRNTRFHELCTTIGWQPAAAQLHYVSYWIAPEWVSPRYATRFFAAAMPVEQQCMPDGLECLNYRWLRPEDALVRKDELALTRPTLENLKSVSGYGSTGQLLDELARRTVPSVPVIWPHKVDGEVLLDASPEQLRNLKVSLPTNKSGGDS